MRRAAARRAAGLSRPRRLRTARRLRSLSCVETDHAVGVSLPVLVQAGLQRGVTAVQQPTRHRTVRGPDAPTRSKRFGFRRKSPVE